MKKPRQSTKRERELVALKKLPDSRIDTKDIPEIREWDGAVRGRFYRPVKKAISLRLDADVLAWFKARGEKYQTKINEILRQYMERHQ